MATKTKQNEGGSKRSESLWDWGTPQPGVLVGAAVAGAALGFAANYGRKFLIQATSGAAGDWADALIAEHQMTLALFDKIEATEDSATAKRSILLHQLKFALSKHAIEEEMVIYPALREAGMTAEADELNGEHGYVKTYLYELETLANDDPQWIARVRDFRAMIEEHMQDEETKVFPALRASLSDDQSKKLTAMMNKEGFLFA